MAAITDFTILRPRKKSRNNIKKERPVRFSPYFLVATVIAVLLCASPVAAQSDTWEVTFAPYLMAAGMDGTVTVRGHEADVNVSAKDVFSNLQFGVMGLVVARKGDWGVAGDAIYAALGGTAETPPANIDFDQGLFTFMGMRRLSPIADLTFGLRWNLLRGQIGFKGPLQLEVKKTKQWVDPIVGVILRSPERGRWHAHLIADVGGFGAGSDFVWHLFPTVGVRVGKRSSLEFGYRFLHTNYKSGDGNDLFKFDVLMQGPVIGSTIKFGSK